MVEGVQSDSLVMMVEAIIIEGLTGNENSSKAGFTTFMY